MTKYTFTSKFLAHTLSGSEVTIPDQVADDQKGYDGETFIVIRENGSRARARLMGAEYGLHTSGTGDVVVKMS